MKMVKDINIFLQRLMKIQEMMLDKQIFSMMMEMDI
jgi:hypothetical protein